MLENYMVIGDAEAPRCHKCHGSGMLDDVEPCEDCNLDKEDWARWKKQQDEDEYDLTLNNMKNKVEAPELIVNPKEYGLEEMRASDIEKSFLPKIIEREALFHVYSNILTKELNDETCKEAGELRKKLVKVRTGIAEVHKVEKAFYFQAGKYVDALKNKSTLPIEQMEEKLTEIEKHFEKIEAEKKEALKQERNSLLIPYLSNAAELSLWAVGEMSDEAFDRLLQGQKLSHQAKIESEKKAEQERKDAEIAYQAEQERIRVENAKLKAEVEAREAERKVIEEKNRAEREASEKKIAAIQAEQDAKLKAEVEAREKLEAENKTRLDKEEKELKRIEAENKKAAAAPDREKLIGWINSINVTQVDIKDPELLITANEILTKFNGFKSWSLSLLAKKK